MSIGAAVQRYILKGKCNSLQIVVSSRRFDCGNRKRGIRDNRDSHRRQDQQLGRRHVYYIASSNHGNLTGMSCALELHPLVTNLDEIYASIDFREHFVPPHGSFFLPVGPCKLPSTKNRYPRSSASLSVVFTPIYVDQSFHLQPLLRDSISQRESSGQLSQYVGGHMAKSCWPRQHVLPPSKQAPGFRIKAAQTACQGLVVATSKICSFRSQSNEGNSEMLRNHLFQESMLTMGTWPRDIPKVSSRAIRQPPSTACTKHGSKTQNRSMLPGRCIFTTWKMIECPSNSHSSHRRSWYLYPLET